jgi:hypothetical protein
VSNSCSRPMLDTSLQAGIRGNSFSRYQHSCRLTGLSDEVSLCLFPNRDDLDIHKPHLDETSIAETIKLDKDSKDKIMGSGIHQSGEQEHNKDGP